MQVYTLLTGVLCDETADYLVAFRSEFVVSQASLFCDATCHALHCMLVHCPAVFVDAWVSHVTHQASWLASSAQARLLAQPLSTYQKLHSWVKVRSRPVKVRAAPLKLAWA